MKENKKIYFASDFHLGIPNLEESHKRERKIIRWLESIREDAKSIYLVGDIFDFWFEYKKVVPKGFVRLLAKLAELSEEGIEINYLPGNHDLWVNDYFEKEIGIRIHYTNIIILEQGKKIFIGHGDGLGNGDYSYKILQKIFKSKICQWLFGCLHPNFGIGLAHLWSESSRKNKYNKKSEEKNKDILIGYCRKQQNLEPVDYYIFGHTHLPLQTPISENCHYFNIGDWINHFSYAYLSDGKMSLTSYKEK